jgi:hypothetical protein
LETPPDLDEPPYYQGGYGFSQDGLYHLGPQLVTDLIELTRVGGQNFAKFALHEHPAVFILHVIQIAVGAQALAQGDSDPLRPEVWACPRAADPGLPSAGRPHDG